MFALYDIRLFLLSSHAKNAFKRCKILPTYQEITLLKISETPDGETPTDLHHSFNLFIAVFHLHIRNGFQ